jgi:hypothetical protein
VDPYHAPPLPMIRYFAGMDDTLVGKAALAYCEALVALQLKVRLLAADVANMQVDLLGGGGGAWGKFRSLTGTRMAKEYINLVCTDPSHWDRLWVAPTVTWNGGASSGPSGCGHNVLIAPASIKLDRLKPPPMLAALRYQVLVVPDVETSEAWQTHLPPNRFAVVVAPGDLEALRTALTPY